MAPKSTPFAPSNASIGSGMNEYPVFTVSFSLFVSFDDAVLSAPEAGMMLKISPAAVNVNINIFFISGRKGTKFSRLRKSLLKMFPLCLKTLNIVKEFNFNVLKKAKL